MGNYQVIFVFPFVYTLLLTWSFVAPRAPRFAIGICDLSACCLALLYATTFFHPQYFTWIVVFLVILRAETNDPVLRNLHYVLILLFFPYTFFWREALFGMLLAPLDPDFFASIASPWTWMRRIGPPEILVNIVRSLISAFCLALVGWILLGRRYNRASGRA